MMHRYVNLVSITLQGRRIFGVILKRSFANCFYARPPSPLPDNPYPALLQDIKGNSCDSSGYYPGQTMYKDPIRPAVTWADYQASLAKKAAKGQ